MTKRKSIGEMTPLGRERAIRRAVRQGLGDYYTYIEHTPSGGAHVQVFDIPLAIQHTPEEGEE